jgi:hypothetical protein
VLGIQDFPFRACRAGLVPAQTTGVIASEAWQSHGAIDCFGWFRQPRNDRRSIVGAGLVPATYEGFVRSDAEDYFSPPGGSYHCKIFEKVPYR